MQELYHSLRHCCML